MSRDAGTLAASLAAATDPSFRGRLLARGQAQSMIRRAGVLPADAPRFGAFLDVDLLNYAYAMMSTSLDLLEADDSDTPEQARLAQEGFIQASYALEAATRNAAAEEDQDQAFHRLIAGAASHLGGYAARAFSLMQVSRRTGRLTPMEETLADLAMRDLDAIEQRTRSLRSSPQLSDDALLAAFAASATTIRTNCHPRTGSVPSRCCSVRTILPLSLPPCLRSKLETESCSALRSAPSKSVSRPVST